MSLAKTLFNYGTKNTIHERKDKLGLIQMKQKASNVLLIALKSMPTQSLSYSQQVAEA